MVIALEFGRVVLVRVLSEVIAMCSWARHFTLTLQLPTHVFKWLSIDLMLGVALQWTSISWGLAP